MRKRTKTFKYYLSIFLMSAVVVLAYSLYMILSGKAVASDLISFWFLPPVFVALYYGSDVLIDKINSKKRKTNPEKDFMNGVSQKMRDSKEFLIEDFRRLQENKKFQDALKVAYQISQDGEKETWTLEKLEKKFRQGTVEAKAMEMVLSYTKEILESRENKPNAI